MKAIFFDFDGVLTLKESGSLSTCEYLAEKTGISYHKLHEHYQNAFAGRDVREGILTEENWKVECDRGGLDIRFELLAHGMGNPPKNGEMLDLIFKLKDKYKVGLITDNSVERIALLSQTYDFSKLFDTVTVSGSVGACKTKQKIFDVALADMRVSASESVFIDNRAKNLIIPKQMGLATYLYDYEKQTIDDVITWFESLGVDI